MPSSVAVHGQRCVLHIILQEKERCKCLHLYLQGHTHTFAFSLGNTVELQESLCYKAANYNILIALLLAHIISTPV